MDNSCLGNCVEKDPESTGSHLGEQGLSQVQGREVAPGGVGIFLLELVMRRGGCLFGSEGRDGRMVNYAHLSKPRWTMSESPLGRMYQLRKEGEEEKGWGQSSVLVPCFCRT